MSAHMRTPPLHAEIGVSSGRIIINSPIKSHHMALQTQISPPLPLRIYFAICVLLLSVHPTSPATRPEVRALLALSYSTISVSKLLVWLARRLAAQKQHLTEWQLDISIRGIAGSPGYPSSIDRSLPGGGDLSGVHTWVGQTRVRVSRES